MENTAEGFLSESGLEKFQSSSLHDDELLGCLEILCLKEHLSFSRQGIVSGLPLVNDRITPLLFERAAARAGFESKVVKRDLDSISNLVLPAVLILDGNHACVINQIVDESKVEIILPETVRTPKYVSLKELRKYYSGYAIFVQPQRKFEKRAEQFHTVF